METKCSEEELEIFGKEMYTYINQIFGDQTVRSIINDFYMPLQEQMNIAFGLNILSYTQPIYDFSIIQIPEMETEHHILVKRLRPMEILCSVDLNIQNITKDINDTLCQSYSLLNYFHIPIATDKKERQLQMIRMYRILLNNNELKQKIIDEIIDNYKNLLKQNTKASRRKLKQSDKWYDFTNPKNPLLFRKTSSQIFENIQNTLDKWNNFGYLYFIGEGNCNSYEIYLNSKRKRSRDYKEQEETKDIQPITTRSMRRRLDNPTSIISLNSNIGGKTKKIKKKYKNKKYKNKRIYKNL
jgi:hypothetical protein